MEGGRAVARRAAQSWPGRNLVGSETLAVIF
jgi:hypothetical protein